MRVAMTIWNGRISPVFDTARELLVTDANGPRLLDGQWEDVAAMTLSQRVERLRALNVDALICGALSRPLAEMLASAGIRTIPFVAGDAEEVLAAYLNGGLPAALFTMPGCGHGRRLRGQCGKRGNKNGTCGFRNSRTKKET